ncbi:MAG TPA: DUF4157 domain-containing protein [Actinomycetes bacterium]|nr:DUF4157 domain-containing protein [Actinomycetes bacterium]
MSRPRGGDGRREDGLGAAVPARRSRWGYLWAAPNTLVGLLAAATVRGRAVRWRGTLLIEQSRGGVAWFIRRRGFAAITLGHVIVVVGRAGDRLLAHELTHVGQHERWGVAFYPAYLLASVSGYRRNPFERAARRVEEELARGR